MTRMYWVNETKRMNIKREVISTVFAQSWTPSPMTETQTWLPDRVALPLLCTRTLAIYRRLKQLMGDGRKERKYRQGMQLQGFQ